MRKRNMMRLAMLTTGTLLAIDLSPCGPAGELMEMLLPVVIMGMAT